MPYPTKKLGEIVDILDNQRKPISSIEREKRIKGKDILYPYYGATQQNGVIDDYLFDEELVLLGEDGVEFYSKYKHKAYLVNGKTWINNHVHVLKGKDGILLNKFLLNYLNIFDYHGYVSGATRLKLNQSSMRNIPIPLPSLPTQKLIVQKLDSSFEKIDKSIELTKKNLANIEELNKSVLEEIFREGEYEKIKIGKIITLNYGKGVEKEDKLENGEIDVYGANGVMYKTNKFLYDGESIIVGRKGSAGALKRVYGKFWASDVTYYITMNKNDNLDYIYNGLKFLNIPSLAQGVKPGINRNHVYELKIPLPPLQKQKEITQYLDKVFEKNKALKESYEKKLKDLEEMKKSLLKEAFEGRLVN